MKLFIILLLGLAAFVAMSTDAGINHKSMQVYAEGCGGGA